MYYFMSLNFVNNCSGFTNVKFASDIYILFACVDGIIFQLDFETGDLINYALTSYTYIGWIPDASQFVNGLNSPNSSISIDKYSLTNMYECGKNNTSLAVNQSCPICLKSYFMNSLNQCVKNYIDYGPPPPSPVNSTTDSTILF